MTTLLYCWRCRREVPMLSDSEFYEVAALAATYAEEMRTQVEASGRSVRDLFNSGWLPRILLAYEGFTGVHETNINAIWHHVASLYGPPCRHCGKVLRTPEARFCFLCHRNQDASD